MNSASFWKSWKSMSWIFSKFCTHLAFHDKPLSLKFQALVTSGQLVPASKQFSARPRMLLLARTFLIIQIFKRHFFTSYHEIKFYRKIFILLFAYADKFNLYFLTSIFSIRPASNFLKTVFLGIPYNAFIYCAKFHF